MKYQRPTASGCRDKEKRKSELVLRTQFFLIILSFEVCCVVVYRGWVVVVAVVVVVDVVVVGVVGGLISGWRSSRRSGIKNKMSTNSVPEIIIYNKKFRIKI